MDAGEIEALAERAATKALDGLFVRLGVDISRPLEMQKDFAHLRWWRETLDSARARGVFVAISVLVTGFIATLFFPKR